MIREVNKAHADGALVRAESFAEGLDAITGALTEAELTTTPASDALDFAIDLFAGLVEDAPRQIGPIEKRHAWADKLVRALDDLEVYGKLQSMTIGNPEASAAALDEILKHLAIQIEQEQKQGGDESGGDEDENEGEQEASELAEAIEQIAQGLEDQSSSDDPSKSGPAACGVGGRFDPPKLQEDKVQALIDRYRNDPRMARAIDALGRMQEAYTTRDTEPSAAMDEIAGIEIGGDLPRILPSQLARLKIRALRPLVLNDLVRRQLLQYEMSGTSPRRRRGPIAICLDESGSMRGDRAELSHAIAAVVALHAARQHRPAAICGFDHRLCWQVDQPAIAPKLDQIIERILRGGGGGGTDFDAPLRFALDYLKREPRADILFVTDGVAYVSDEIVEELKRSKDRGTRLFVFRLGAETEVLEAIADEILDVDQLDQHEIAKSQLFT